MVAAVVALAAVACGSSGGGASSTFTVPPGPALSGDVAVSAVDNNFRPQDLVVELGSVITWTNEGRTDHNIVAVGDTPFAVPTDRFHADDTYRWTADELGTFHYFCSIHGTATAGMIGSITVVAPGGSR